MSESALLASVCHELTSMAVFFCLWLWFMAVFSQVLFLCFFSFIFSIFRALFFLFDFSLSWTTFIIRWSFGHQYSTISACLRPAQILTVRRKSQIKHYIQKSATLLNLTGFKTAFLTLIGLKIGEIGGILSIQHVFWIQKGRLRLDSRKNSGKKFSRILSYFNFWDTLRVCWGLLLE